MAEINPGDHQLGKVAPKSARVPGVFGEADGRAHRYDLHRPRARPDHVRRGVCRPGGQKRYSQRTQAPRAGASITCAPHPGLIISSRCRPTINYQLPTAMLVLIVQFTVKPGAEKQTLEIMRKMEEHTRREPGNRLYVGQQSTQDPRNFCFYEQYVDEAALAA